MLGEKMFLNMLILVIASTYWYITGHYIPSLLGVIFILIYLYAEELYFASLIMGVFTLLSIIYFSFYTTNAYTDGSDISQTGISVLYILVIFFQSKSIFNAD